MFFPRLLCHVHGQMLVNKKLVHGKVLSWKTVPEIKKTQFFLNTSVNYQVCVNVKL